jgi:hypothetical protein
VVQISDGAATLRHAEMVSTILRRLVATVALFATATTVDAQTVAGIVTDSIGKIPLRGAIVQLAPDSGPGRHFITDSLGRFEFSGVAAGRYLIGFIHPLLDSIGLEPTIRAITVTADKRVDIELAVPSTRSIRHAMCGAQSNGKAVITGFVRDARDGTPVRGAAVAADWLELTFQKGGIQRVIPRSDAITKANGWFALCNVPSDGIMGLFAARGADSTDVLDVHVPENGFLHHDLYLGGAREGRLTGTVVSALSGQPISGAQVSISGAAPVRADARGSWTVERVTLGTRLMEVKAVGFYPEHRGVNVTADAPPVHVGLSNLRAVLDTVRIRSARLLDRRESGFEDRRQHGAGFYLTAQDIARRNVHSTADLFTGLRGIKIGFASDTMLSDLNALVDPDSLKTTQRRLLMRGMTGNVCAPSIFLNGLYIDRIDADDLDTWAAPREISGIEIYSEATAPVEFQRVGKGCGSIIIWTKR